MTPAIDCAKKNKIAYKIYEYEHNPSAETYGEEAAEKLAIEPARVFKTLVVSSPQHQLAVALVAVSNRLNLKKLAKALAWKKVTMANKNMVSKSTGYVIGGVSPLGQKKTLATVIDISSEVFATIFVSAGKRGLEIELNPQDLALLTNAKFVDIAQQISDSE